MDELCRICKMNQKYGMTTLLDSDKNNELTDCGQKFENCLDLKVLDIPNYTNICFNCKRKLFDFHKFKLQAIKSHSELIILNSKSLKGNFDEIILNNEREIQNESINTNHSNFEYVEGGKILENDDEDRRPYSSQQLSSLTKIIKTSTTIENTTKTDEITKLDESMDDEEFELAKDEEIEEIEKISLDEIDDLDDMEINNILQEKDERKIYRCIMCRRFLDNEKDYKNHMRLHRKAALSIQKQEKKKKIMQYKCNTCDKSFAIEETYNAHINTHKGLSAYSCEICGKGFNQKAQLIYHLKNHKNERSWKCEICSKAFLTKWDIMYHMRHHTTERPFVCDVCGKTFKSLMNLKCHQHTHVEDNNYECEICHKKLHTKQTLRGHIKFVHKTDRRLFCKLCNKQFNRRYRFIDHMKKIHKEFDPEILSILEYRKMNG